MNEVTEHYAMDVPRLTRIVEPEEHAGKLIMAVEYIPTPLRQVKYIIDSGEVLWLPSHSKVKVETGMERAGKLAWARAVANGEHPPVADQLVVDHLAKKYRKEYDSISIETPDEIGRVRVCGYLDDVMVAVSIVSPDGTISPKLTPTQRDFRRVDDRTPEERASGPSSDEANRAAGECG